MNWARTAIILHIDLSVRAITIEKWQVQFHEEAFHPLRAPQSRESTLISTGTRSALDFDVVLLFEARPPYIPSMFLMENTTHLAAFANGPFHRLNSAIR